MSSYARKVDKNQPDIVKALRKQGCTVSHLHEVGNGITDIAAGITYGGFSINLLIEIKDGDLPPSARKLTPDQVAWHDMWQGQKCVVNSVEEAVLLVNHVRALLVNLTISGKLPESTREELTNRWGILRGPDF
jgi:hypothetical protein